MTFTSFAQNLEDVLLWRALKHIDHGFYIDVGAWSPEVDSVTKAFYDRGWSGVNIEPNSDFSEEYKQNRKRDINLAVVLGETKGSTEIHLMDSSGLSTIKPEIKAFHDKAGCKVTTKKVPMLTLADVCDKYAEKRDIHFLKVDVEGAEQEVLRGADWEKHRPWIVVVEATYPMSQKETYSQWEPLLLEKQYQFAFADGLNRYYVAEEHKELKDSFRFPANVFDNYKLAEHAALEEQMKEQAGRFQEALKKASHFADKQQNLIDQLLIARDVLTKQVEEFEANRQLMEQRVGSLEQQLNVSSQEIKKHHEANTALHNQLKDREEHIVGFKAQVVHLEAHINAITHQMAAYQHELNTAYNTVSWRVTKPLRALNAFIKKIRAKLLRRARA